jgi:hypothetical protein
MFLSQSRGESDKKHSDFSHFVSDPCADRDSLVKTPGITGVGRLRMSMPPPPGRPFPGSENWPPDLAQLHDAACEAYAAGAYTAAGVVCGHLLAVWAARESLSGCEMFLEYVDEIIGTPLAQPEGEAGADPSRKAGNRGPLRTTTHEEASRVLAFVQHLLNSVYRAPPS